MSIKIHQEKDHTEKCYEGGCPNVTHYCLCSYCLARDKLLLAGEVLYNTFSAKTPNPKDMMGALANWELIKSMSPRTMEDPRKEQCCICSGTSDACCKMRQGWDPGPYSYGVELHYCFGCMHELSDYLHAVAKDLRRAAKDNPIIQKRIVEKQKELHLRRYEVRK